MAGISATLGSIITALGLGLTLTGVGGLIGIPLLITGGVLLGGGMLYGVARAIVGIANWHKDEAKIEPTFSEVVAVARIATPPTEDTVERMPGVVAAAVSSGQEQTMIMDIGQPPKLSSPPLPMPPAIAAAEEPSAVAQPSIYSRRPAPPNEGKRHPFFWFSADKEKKSCPKEEPPLSSKVVRADGYQQNRFFALFSAGSRKSKHAATQAQQKRDEGPTPSPVVAAVS